MGSSRLRGRVAAATASLVLAVGVVSWGSPGVVLGFTASGHAAFTLEGCRNDGSIILPIDGRFVCPDAAYTTGNLGKGWNELDLVPHRLTAQLGSQVAATTDYDVLVAADYQTGDHVGYDIISAPAVNTSKSDASCSVTAGPQSTSGSAADPFGGGTDVVIYRQLTIHQSKGSTCVFDYYQRLALGAHLYPGSSLQSYMFQDPGFSVGKKTVSIPVNQILPQSVSKDMSASEGADYAWNVTKSPTPATLSFGNTCDSQQATSQAVQIEVKWTKQAATLGAITVITHVYATNPAARVITTNVTDVIYSGASTVLDTATSGPVNIPADTASYLLLTHTTTVPAGTANLNDVATATYTDLVTGIPVPGTTTATASATPQVTYTNNSAVVNDLESITGSGLSYSADSFTPSGAGAFDGGYTAGTKTTGNVSWTSVSQPTSGSVTFNKTVYVGGPSQVTGNLHDAATLTGSDGFSTSATADVTIQTDARVALTINKSVSPALTTGSQTFTFHVLNASNVEVAAPTITFNAGDTSKSTTVANLAPGSYSVTEDTATGWTTDSAKSTTISLPSCAGSVSFTNSQLGSLKVAKSVVWNGITPDSSQTFQICVAGPSFTTPDCKTIGYLGGDLVWSNIIPGEYTVTETDPGVAWTVTGGGGVSVPSGGTGTSTVTNTRKLGSLKVTKTVDWNGVTPDPAKTFEICITGPSYPTKNCQTIGYQGGDLVWNDLIPGQYTVTESSPGATWGVEVGGSPVTVPIDGGQAAATVTNSTCDLTITKNIPAISDTDQTFQFQVLDGSSNVVATISVTVPAGKTTGSTAYAAGLAPGTYTIHELTPSGPYTAVDDFEVTLTAGAACTASTEVTDNFALGNLQVTKVVDWNGITPDTAQTFEICIAGPSYPSGNCKSVGYDGGLLTWSNLIVGSYTVTETNPGTSWTVSITGSPIVVPFGGTGSATVTNTRKLGSLKVTKTVNWLGAPDTAQTFQICITGPSYASPDCKTIGYAGGDLLWTGLIPGAYTVAETDPGTAWTVTVTGSPADVPTDGGQATATVTNSQKPGFAKVVKTVIGQPPASGQVFTFQLRQGASPSAEGNVLQQADATAANGGVINFTSELVPGAHYQLCEWVMPGWNTSLGPNLFVPGSIIPPSLPNPNVNNMTVCTDFVAQAAQTTTFTVDNTPPPGGRALTIGFWKNWASCANSNGKQKPMLDQTLAIATAMTTNPPGGMVVSAQSAGGGWPNYAATYYLVLKGSTATPNAAPNCQAAVYLLNKMTIDGKKKMASDPLYNMAAQLVGAQLNYFAGAGGSGPTTLNIQSGVLLLGKYHFNGLTYSPKLSSADTTRANCLAKQLDNYNNDRAVATCP